MDANANAISTAIHSVYLFWLLLASLALSGQYALLLFISIQPSKSTTTQIIFWSGLFPGSLLPATPATILFLSLDRLLIVLLPSLYLHKFVKIGFAACSSMAVIGLFTMSFGLNLAQRPTREVPGGFLVNFGE